ncbi:MAG: hypothetical protein RRY12_12070 [Cloacibacillus sp.]
MWRDKYHRLAYLLVLQLFVLCLPRAAVAFPALFELEGKVGDGAEVMAALYSLQRDSELEKLESDRSGTKYFLTASFGYNNEPQFDTSENTLSYQKLSVGVGLSFPLAGTWNKQKINRLTAELKGLDSKYRAQILRVNNLSALRKAYAVLWAESQKIKAAEAFLSTRAAVTRVLDERRQKALLLPSDNLEFIAAYDMAKRDVAASKLHKVQALQIIRLATGAALEMPEDLSAPELPVFNGTSADIEGNPSLVLRRESLAKYEKIVCASKKTDREAAFIIGGVGTKDFPGDYGSGVYASVVITEPIKRAASANDRSLSAAQIELSRAREEANFTRLKIEGEAEEAFFTASYAAANIDVQLSRLRSIAEAVHERAMRHGAIAGDTFEQLQASRYQYYRTVADMIDSQLILLQSGADILSYAYPAGNSGEPSERRAVVDEAFLRGALSPQWFVQASFAAAPAADTAVALSIRPASVYVWRAAPFLNAQSRAASLTALKANGVSDMLLSFTASELAWVKTAPGERALKELLAAAAGAGIKTELLLGDPTWIFPKNRQNLINIISAMSKFKFCGVHLDIEPDSLPNGLSMRPKYVKLLAATIREAARRSTRPVSFSIHPRYLSADYGRVIAGGLRGVKIAYIAPMIYSTETGKTTAALSSILARYPQFDFKLAQSVERSLPASESYASAGRSAFYRAMGTVRRGVEGYKNFRGIVVQDWDNYERMRP